MTGEYYTLDIDLEDPNQLAEHMGEYSTLEDSTPWYVLEPDVGEWP